MNKRMQVWGPAAGWAVVLFLLSAVSGTGLGLFVPYSDKLAHLGLYAVLGMALARVRLGTVPGLPHALLVSLGLLYGLSDELHQAFVPGRTPDVGDWLADAVGVVIGYCLVLRWRRRADGGDPEESK